MHKAKKSSPPQAALVTVSITAAENRLEWIRVDQDAMFLFNKNPYMMKSIFNLKTVLTMVGGKEPEDFSVIINSYQFITSFSFLHKIDELFSSF